MDSLLHEHLQVFGAVELRAARRGADEAYIAYFSKILLSEKMNTLRECQYILAFTGFHNK